MFVKQNYQIRETRDSTQSNDGLRSYIKDDKIFLNHLKHETLAVLSHKRIWKTHTTTYWQLFICIIYILISGNNMRTFDLHEIC